MSSVLFSSFVHDGRQAKLPQLLAPTFRHAKGSFHTLLLGWALPLSLRDFSYQQSSQERTDMFQLQISRNTYPLRHKLHAPFKFCTPAPGVNVRPRCDRRQAQRENRRGKSGNNHSCNMKAWWARSWSVWDGVPSSSALPLVQQPSSVCWFACSAEMRRVDGP